MYKIIDSQTVQDVDTTSFVPVSDVAYKNWLAAGNIPLPADPPSIDHVRMMKGSELFSAYQIAISQPVSYTSQGGITNTFQADPVSVSNTLSAIAGYQNVGATPQGFFWVASDNTRVLFTYADIQGLANAMISQGWAQFQRYQDRKDALRNAATVADIQAITY
jgi:hypothetical protein